MLIVKQASFVWRCRSPNLWPIYSEVVALLEQLRRNRVGVEIAHIYREFNAIADGWANEVLNRQVANITYNW